MTLFDWFFVAGFVLIAGSIAWTLRQIHRATALIEDEEEAESYRQAKALSILYEIQERESQEKVDRFIEGFEAWVNDGCPLLPEGYKR